MSDPKRSRRHFTTEQKVAILKRHMVDKVPVSDLCNEFELQPSVFYQWQRQVLENLAGAFSTPADDGPSKRERELLAKTKELEHCAGMADGTNLDWDFGSSPNVFTVGGRTLVGIGQKSGYYHAFDATTGQIVWQRQVSVAQHNGGSMGILWGTASDGHRLYVATWLGKPGTLFGLDPATGEILWRTPNPADGCTTGGAAAHSDVCTLANMAAVTATPGLVYEGGMDGKMRIYRAEDGAILWQYDTVREFTGANHVTGPGGAIAGHGGAVVAHGMLYVRSGYYSWFGIPGRVLLAFGL